MKLFQNKHDNKNNQMHEEQADKATLVLSARQVSWVASGFLLISFFIFMAGYFLGQRKVFADFTGKVEQESFGDMIFASLYTKDFMDGADEEGGGADSIVVTDETVSPDAIDNDLALQAQDVQEIRNVCTIYTDDEIEKRAKDEQNMRYYAELIGFGTARAAQLFVERLQKDGITVDIRKRISKTSHGKQVAWYQVVTEEFDESAPLLDLVKKLEKKEHLKGVNIQTCS